MAASRGDAFDASPPPAAKRPRQRAPTLASSSDAPDRPDDFSHCLIYNVSLADMLVSTLAVAESTAGGGDDLDDARRRLCASLARPKFSYQVRDGERSHDPTAPSDP